MHGNPDGAGESVNGVSMEKTKQFAQWSISSLVAGITADDFDFSKSRLSKL
jgi:hypothetical protein